jgi:hypothetical protein
MQQRRAGEGLASLGGRIAVRVVAELAQHPRSQHHPEPGQTPDDRRVWMGREPAGELPLQSGDLRIQAAEHGHQGSHHLAVSGLDRLWGGELGRRQRIMDGHHPRLQVPTPTSLNKRPPHRRLGEPPAQLRRRRQLEHRQCLGLGELGAERGQRPGVELPRRASQGIDVPLPRPDQALMGAGQHLNGLHQRAVAGDRPVVMAVGPDQISQHLGIPTVRLGPRDLVATAVAADDLRVTAYTW